MSRSAKTFRFRGRPDRGAVMVAGIIVLAALIAIAGVTLRRTMTSSTLTGLERSADQEDAIRKSIISMALLKIKNYAWTSGQNLGQLLPTTGTRFKNWAAGGGTYNGVPYTIDIGDNYETSEGGAQNYYTDVDNTAYAQITMTINGKSHMSRVLMSPGNPASAGSGTPANIPAAIGVCYGWLNFITLVTMKTGSLVSGYDKLPPGWGSCPSSPSAANLAQGGLCDDSNDQYGIASTSWLGTWNLGQIFDISGLQGQVTGIPQPNGTASPSFGRPTAADCTSYDRIQTTADNLLAANDSRVTLYQQNLGTKSVSGNLTFGTQANPAVLYVKTGWFGTVQFNGSVSGWGILVADGNVNFQSSFAWNGVIINNANTIGNVLTFNGTTSVFGGAMINRPILSAEIGSASLDIRFASSNTNLYFSQEALDNSLSHLDPNYVPPAGTEGHSVGITSIQHIN